MASSLVSYRYIWVWQPCGQMGHTTLTHSVRPSVALLDCNKVGLRLASCLLACDLCIVSPFYALPFHSSVFVPSLQTDARTACANAVERSMQFLLRMQILPRATLAVAQPPEEMDQHRRDGQRTRRSALPLVQYQSIKTIPCAHPC
jgi:hypothetical protein